MVQALNQGPSCSKMDSKTTAGHLLHQVPAAGTVHIRSEPDPCLDEQKAIGLPIDRLNPKRLNRREGQLQTW